MAKETVRMEGAPYWYDTPLDQLDFQWSSDEKLEIERYCEKIHKNIAEEEMTPKERFAATVAGKERDRCFITFYPLNVYAVRTLDSHADALMPIDVYKSPKLLVKAHLACVARFKADWLFPYTLGYSEELWGGRSKLIDYGNPLMVGDPPIKSVADLEGLEVPDPKKNGLYPGYLWAVRELKKIIVEHDLDDKLEFMVAASPDSVATAMLGMMGIAGFMAATRKDPELCKRCVDLADEFVIKYCQAVIEMGASSLQIDFGPGWLPIEGNEWTLDHHLKVDKTVGPQVTSLWGMAAPADLQWFPLLFEKGMMGPNGFAGWTAGGYMDYKKVIDPAREHNILCNCLLPSKVLLNGPISDIEDVIRERYEYGKPYPKFTIGIGDIDYWTPQTHIDAAVEATRKYGKY